MKKHIAKLLGLCISLALQLSIVYLCVCVCTLNPRILRKKIVNHLRATGSKEEGIFNDELQVPTQSRILRRPPFFAPLVCW